MRALHGVFRFHLGRFATTLPVVGKFAVNGARKRVWLLFALHSGTEIELTGWLESVAEAAAAAAWEEFCEREGQRGACAIVCVRLSARVSCLWHWPSRSDYAPVCLPVRAATLALT